MSIIRSVDFRTEDRMAATATPPKATQAITYDDLYRRWEQSNWSATAIDFTEDARQWREEFTEFERTAALWNYALFFWGEDAVADGLSPYVEAAPREEQKYFLTTQQVDEARHSVFFKRFMREVCGIGDGTIGGGLAGIEPQLTWGFRKVFARLERMEAELHKDPSVPKLCAAIALYHFTIEATLAQTGQSFITDYLEERDLLPGFREGMARVAHDEHRHIAFGVKFLSEHAHDERCRTAVAEILREVTPWTACVLDPPGGDRRYTEVFGKTLEDLSEMAVVSLQAKLRSAGMPSEDLPGPALFFAGMEPRQIAERAEALRRAGVFGPPGRAISRDPVAVGLVADTVARRLDAAAAGGDGFTVELAFRDTAPWHLVTEDGAVRAVAGPAPGRPEVRLRTGYDDFVEVMAGNLTPPRAVLRGRLLPVGRPRDLRRFGAMLGAA
jgi:hypothetical protein